MLRALLASVVAIVLSTLVLGFAYPALMTGIAAAHDVAPGERKPDRAQRKVVGSSLAAQSFTVAALLPRAAVGDVARRTTRRSRPSRTSARRTRRSRKLVKQNADAILKLEGPYNPGLTIHQIPVDAVVPSGSGIDPEISIAYADLQARRVAAVRHLPLATVQQLIEQHTEGRQLGFFGEAGVNVLNLNLALDSEQVRADGTPLDAACSRAISSLAAIRDSFPKLDPRLQLHNPVMFIVELGSVITTVIFFKDLVQGNDGQLWFVGVIAIWLWLTVLFANFAEAIAEGRGKAQANALRATRTTTTALRRSRDGHLEEIAAADLQKGDIVVVEAGMTIPADGEIIEGAGSVDESAITGESAPVIREAGGDRSAVTGGTKLLSDRLVIEVTQEPGQSFLDRMIALVEGAERRKTPNEIALNILLAGLTITFVAAVVTLRPYAHLRRDRSSPRRF